MAIEKLERLDVMGGQGVVGEKDPAGVHHPSDAGHRQGLLEAVIIDEDVGSDHQVESLRLLQFRTLSHYIQIQWRDT